MTRTSTAGPRAADAQAPELTAAPEHALAQARALAPEQVFAPAHRADPYPVYRRLRAAGRWHPVGAQAAGAGSLTMITGFRDCAELLQSRSWGFTGPGANAFRDGDSGDGLRSMLRTDPPDHTRLRSLVSQAFTGRTVAQLRAETVALAEARVAALAAASARPGEGAGSGEAAGSGKAAGSGEAAAEGPVDLLEAFARPVPLRVICALLGVPPEDEPLFGAWTATLTRGLDPDSSLTPRERRERAAATTAFAAYVSDLIARRRARPADDLLSRLIAARDRDGMLTEAEVIETCVLLLVAGHETTVNLVANTVLALARRPEQYALLRARPDLVPSAVEETLRFDPPVQWLGRRALADTEIAGRSFTVGDGVVLLLAGAGRDPGVFADPDRYDVTRYAGPAPAHRHLGFGHGIHFCLGAPLARMEATVMLAALTRQFDRIRLVDDPPRYRPHVAVRGVETLPVLLLT